MADDLTEPSPEPAVPPIRVAALACLGYLFFRWALVWTHLPLRTPVLVLLLASGVVAAGSLGLPIAGIAAIVRTRKPNWTAFLALSGLAVWLLLTLAVSRHWLTQLQYVLLSPVRDLGMIVTVAGFGILMASRLKELNILVPIGMFATFADFVVVHYGTVHRALSTTKGQQMLQSVSAKVPSVHPGIPLLTIGPADFLFLGVFLACADRFGLGVRRNALWFTVILTLSLLLVAITGWPVPALAPMSLTLLALNWRRFRLTRDEWISTGAVLVLIGALFLGYFLFAFPRR